MILRPVEAGVNVGFVHKINRCQVDETAGQRYWLVLIAEVMLGGGQQATDRRQVEGESRLCDWLIRYRKQAGELFD